MPVMTINKQPTNYNYPSFASQFRREKGLTTQISTNKRKHLEKDDGNMDYEDYYATAREYSTSDDDAGGFHNFPDSDTEQPSLDTDDSASNCPRPVTNCSRVKIMSLLIYKILNYDRFDKTKMTIDQ